MTRGLRSIPEDKEKIVLSRSRRHPVWKYVSPTYRVSVFKRGYPAAIFQVLTKNGWKDHRLFEDEPEAL